MSRDPHSELRRENRIPGVGDVLVSNEAWKGFARLQVRNVANGGAFLACNPSQSPAINSMVSIRIGNRSIRGRVAHISRAVLDQRALHGFGVAFGTPHPAWWSAIGLQAASSPMASPVGENGGGPAQNFFGLGMHLFESKNYQLAQQKFQQAQRFGGNPLYLAMSLVCQGYQFMSTAYWSKSKEAFSKALQVAPGCKEARAAMQEFELRSRAL